jgi:hypothetical protein
MTKDIIWAYANAVSQVCVEDDSVSGTRLLQLSCWRVTECHCLRRNLSHARG